MEKVETTTIHIEDKISSCFADSIGIKGKSEKRGPEGWVEIYEVDEKGNKKLHAKSNLVLYCGREWIGSKIFNLENPYLSTEIAEYISWFGVGDGGCTDADPLDPIPPTNNDIALAHEVSISATDATCADFHDGFYWKHPFDSIVYEQDVENDNAWLIVKVITTIGPADSNGQNINECALFTSLSSSAGYGGPFHIYSRVTFPTLVKSSTRQLIFVWFIYV